jgi:hypothetical protein
MSERLRLITNNKLSDEVEAVMPLCDNPHPRDLAKAAVEQHRAARIAPRLITRTTDETLGTSQHDPAKFMRHYVSGPAPSLGRRIWKRILDRLLGSERK